MKNLFNRMTLIMVVLIIPAVAICDTPSVVCALGKACTIKKYDGIIVFPAQTTSFTGSCTFKAAIPANPVAVTLYHADSGYELLVEGKKFTSGTSYNVGGPGSELNFTFNKVGPASQYELSIMNQGDGIPGSTAALTVQCKMN